MTKPRVIGTLLVRDEQDIVLNCIEHHLKHGVDGFIITDNGSSDNTAELCMKHPACLRFIREPSKNFNHQGRWVTRMARLAAIKYGAKWIVNIDADEFFYGADTIQDLPPNINAIKVQGCRHHVLTAEVPYQTFSRAFMPYYYCGPANKDSHGKTIHRANSQIRVVNGNHLAIGPWRNRGVVTNAKFPAFFYHHYEHRSYQRWVIKCRNADEVCNRKPKYKSGRWSAYGRIFQEGRTLETYNQKIITVEQAEYGLLNDITVSGHTGRLFKFVPDDEFDIAELAKRSGFAA